MQASSYQVVAGVLNISSFVYFWKVKNSFSLKGRIKGKGDGAVKVGELFAINISFTKTQRLVIEICETNKDLGMFVEMKIVVEGNIFTFKSLEFLS